MLLTMLRPDCQLLRDQLAIPEDGIALAKYSDGGEVSIRIASPSLPAGITLEQFSCRLVRSHYVAEREWSEIRCKGDTRTIGYVFPTTTLRTGEEVEVAHDRLGRWPRVYLAAAVQFLLHSPIPVESINLPVDLLGTAHDIDSMLPQAAVVVLGWEQLSNLNTSIDEICFGLHRQGYTYFDEALPRSGPVRPGFSSPCPSPRVAAALRSKLALLQAVATSAMNESRAPARYLALYQAFELCIEQVLCVRIRSAVSEHLLGRATRWKLVEDLQSASREQSRLQELFASCLSRAVPNDVEATFIALCGEISKLLEPHRDVADNGIAESLYAVRNYCVHRQSQIAPAVASKLHDAADELAVIMFHVVEHFAPPHTMSLRDTVRQMHDSIAARAYAEWEQAGRPVGRDLEFWTAAEAGLQDMA